jgi:LysM repeat protein
MSNADNTIDKDFVMSDGDASADTIDSDEDEIYENVNVSHRKTSSMPFIIAAVGFLILIILLIAVLSRTQDLAEKKQILALEQRLEQLERRLGGLEDMNKQKIVSAMPEKQLDLLAERLDRLETSVNVRIDQVITELQRDDRTPVQQKATTAKTPPPPKKEKIDAPPTVHKVQAGETLYRISRQYGISIEQLRTYNKLEPNTKIYPGQELKLVP